MRRSPASIAVALGVAVLASATAATSLVAQSAPPRIEAAVTSLFAPADDARLPQVMVGPSATVRLGQALGGVVSVEGAFRFRADGNQLRICPQPPGVVCEARSARSVGSATLQYARGFGAQPLVRGPLVRLAVGGAFASLEGEARVWPAQDGTQPAPQALEKNVGMGEVGLGWLQPVGRTSLRIEGRVNAFTPSLAATQNAFSLVLGIGY